MGILILVMGVPASGKTRLSKELVKRLHCTYLDNNFIADAFYSETRVSNEYKRLRPSLYKALYRITEENLNLGNSVLLDVPHITHMQDVNWRRFLSNLVEKTRSSLKIIRCYCSESELRARIMERGEDRDNWKLNNWKEFLTNEPIMVDIPFPHIDIDTEQSMETIILRALKYINNNE